MLIENAPGLGDAPVDGSGAAVRAELGLWRPVRRWCSTPAPSRRIRGWTCCLPRRAHVTSAGPTRVFVLAGGRPDQVAAPRQRGARRARGRAVIFAGQRPAEEIPAFLDAADVLVSPRSTGTNTPLKIYQYLRSGSRSSRPGC